MEWLKSLGLNKKQSLVYQHLLTKGKATASELARDLGEQRTNIYLLLDVLMQLDLAEKDESSPVTRFKATNPSKLQELMASRQKTLAQSSAQMKQALPELLGLYHMNTAREGMAYFEGLRGYEAALEDMITSEQEVCVFASSDVSRSRPDAWEVLMRKLQKRALAKITTRMIFSKEQVSEINLHEQARRRIDVRFWGDHPFQGEIALYGNTVVLTTYDERLVSLVIKEAALASTFQTIFDSIWGLCPTSK